MIPELNGKRHSWKCTHHSQQPQTRLEASDLQDFANSYHLNPSELCPPTQFTMVYLYTQYMALGFGSRLFHIRLRSERWCLVLEREASSCIGHHFFVEAFRLFLKNWKLWKIDVECCSGWITHTGLSYVCLRGFWCEGIVRMFYCQSWMSTSLFVLWCTFTFVSWWRMYKSCTMNIVQREFTRIFGIERLQESFSCRCG